jgi:hypothetical protein
MEKLDEIGECGAISLIWSPPPIPAPQIPSYMFRCNAVARNASLFEPAAKTRSEHHLAVNVAPRVALLTQ